MRKRHKICLVGTAMLGPWGRPRDVYCNTWRPPHNQLRHEVLLTQFLLRYDHERLRRGNDVDQAIRADAEMWRAGGKFFVELDTGKQTYRRVRRRWKHYVGVRDFLLVVTSTERRMKGLIEHSYSVANIALFTTLTKALENPYGKIWLDTSGKQAALPRE